jgi:putative ABC transport system substrate-binding protein
MRRRQFIALTGAALLGLTQATAAKFFTIGYLALLPGEDRMSFMARFIRRLDELGYKNGQNLHLIYRSAEGQPQLLSGLASELVGMKPDVLVTGLGTVAARAAKAVADGVPIVFMAVGDPVGANIVESLARPGGNVTGLSDLAAHIQGRRLALLRQIVPAATFVAVVLNPCTPYTALAYKELEQAAKIVNIELRAFQVRSPEEMTPQLEATKAGGADALAILEDPLTLSQRSPAH